MLYSQIVGEAKRLIDREGWQLGAPYNGTRKAHTVAMSLARECGEDFLSRHRYGHYYGTSWYGRIPVNSPVRYAAENLPRGVWQLAPSELSDLREKVRVARIDRWLSALAAARKTGDCINSGWCRCSACKNKQASKARLERYKQAKRSLAQLAAPFICSGSTPQARLKSWREERANRMAAIVPFRRIAAPTLRQVWGGSRARWNKHWQHVEVGCIIPGPRPDSPEKPLTAMQKWLKGLGYDAHNSVAGYDWKYYTKDGFRRVEDPIVARYFAKRGSAAWFGDFVREWRKYSGYRNPKERPPWQSAVKRFVVARLAQFCIASEWCWGIKDGVVYFDLPAGQASFHLRYETDKRSLNAAVKGFMNVPAYEKPWSGLRNTPEVLDAQFAENNILPMPVPLPALHDA